MYMYIPTHRVLNRELCDIGYATAARHAYISLASTSVRSTEYNVSYGVGFDDKSGHVTVMLQLAL